MTTSTTKRATSPTQLFLTVIAAIGVAACSGGGQAAEAEYDMVTRSEGGGTLGELCDTAKKAADAYRSDGNEDDYQRMSAIARDKCDSARDAEAAAQRIERDKDRSLERAEEAFDDLENSINAI